MERQCSFFTVALDMAAELQTKGKLGYLLLHKQLSARFQSDQETFQDLVHTGAPLLTNVHLRTPPGPSDTTGTHMHSSGSTPEP